MIHKRDNNTPALDMMFMVALTFLLLVIMMVPFLNPIAKTGVVDPPVSLMVEATWPVDSDTDVDLYVKGPDGNVVYYGHKSNGYVTLKKDDLGFSTDKMVIDGEIMTIPRNYEITTLTTLPDGWYIVNVHLFKGIGEEQETATIRITNILEYDIVFEGSVSITKRQEITVVSFRVVDGRVVELDQEVQHKLRRYSSQGTPAAVPDIP